MTSRLKEDERNERTIRSLLKLPDNRRCINCNSLGPQYVCTNFWTFVCTTCSGIHREFTHRVKSVSMAKFTSQEVSALQGGGNASAKEIYFREWDLQRQSLPDSSNVESLRDFIKHVYVDRRYTGEKSFDKPPRVKMGEAEDSYRGGSRSPPFERPSPGGKSDERQSPGYNQDLRKSPPAARTDTVNSQSDPDMSSPSTVRPVRDILGERVSPLRIIQPPKANGSLHAQRTVSSSSLASSNGNPSELRTENLLIDFNDVPEPPTAQVPQIQQTTTSSSNNNWATFDSVQEVKASHAPSNTNLLDVLSELSVPSSLPATGGSSLTTPVATPISHLTVAPGGTQEAPPGHNAFVNTTDGGQWQNVPPQQAVGGSQNNQPWNPSHGWNTQVLSSSQVTHGVDVKPSTKKELPADLFTSNYSSFAAPGPGWFHAPQYGMGFNMQYNVPTHVPPAYFQPLKPLNPFDVNESSPAQATTFPSMAPLQGILPNKLPQSNIHRTSSLGTSWMPTQSSSSLSHPLPSTIHRTTSLGPPMSAWMPIQSYHPSSMSPQVPSYGPPMPSGPFMGQASPNMTPPPRAQEGGFGSYNYSQQQSGSSFFSSGGGNPFG